MTKEHVSSAFHERLAELRSLLLRMGGEVELMISDAVRSLAERNPELAERVVMRDAVIDRLEVEIDSRCLQLMALRQPAARDLRFVTLALKIVTDLERIGDHCAEIAGQSVALNREPPLKPYIDVPLMASCVSDQLRQALDAFVNADTGLAARVCRDDRKVDLLNEQLQRELLTFMMQDAGTIQRAMRITSVAGYLERIADHAANIAEMVIFMVEGRDVRHASGGGGCAEEERA